MYYYGARYYNPKTGVWLSVDPLVEKTLQPYQYAYNNPVQFIDPTGLQGEDWVKRDDHIFYDKNVKSQADAERLYGKGVEHLGNGSMLTTSQGQRKLSEYTFYSNGTYRDMKGNIMDNTKNVITAGGTTIYGIKKEDISGLAVQGTLSWTIGGGISLSFGYVKDSYGDSSFYYTLGGNLGLGAGLSLDFTTITATDPNSNFRITDFEGYGNSYEIGIGVISGFYGGTTVERGGNVSQLFNYRNWGKNINGYTTKGGSYGIGLDFGVIWSRSKTTLISRTKK